MTRVTGASRGLPPDQSDESRTPARPDADAVTVARGSGWPAGVAGAVAALGATAIVWVAFLVLPALVWFTAENSGAFNDSVLVVAAQAFWAAQGLPVALGDVTITLLPWGWAIVIAVILFASGRWAGRVSSAAGLIPTAIVVSAATAVYCALGLGLAWFIGPPAPAPGRLLLTGVILGGVCLTLGVKSYQGQLRQTVQKIPRNILHCVAAGLTGFLVWVVAGGVLVGVAAVGVAMAPGGSGSGPIAAFGGLDVGGLVAVTAIALGYLPVAIGWAVSYGLGVGFAPIAEATVSPFSALALPELPALPYFTMMPVPPPPGAAALPLVGVLAGVLAAGLLRRRNLRGVHLVVGSLLSLMVSAVLLLGLLIAASGDLGSNRLAGIGPHVVSAVGVACLLWVLGYLIVVVPTLWSDHAHQNDEAWHDHERNAPAGRKLRYVQRD